MTVAPFLTLRVVLLPATFLATHLPEPTFLEAYLSCIPGIYDSYRKAHPDDTDIGELAEKAAEMVMKGIAK